MSDEQPTQPREPFYKRHGLAFAISTLVLGVIVLFGAVGVGAFTVATFASRAVPMMSWPGQPDRGDSGGGGDRGDHGDGDGRAPQNPGQQRGLVRGTIDAVSGSTWTLLTDGGRTVTVKLTSATVYGHPGNEGGSAADFAKGDEVIVVGTRSGSTVTATRVLKLDDFPLRPPSTPGPPATPGSGL